MDYIVGFNGKRKTIEIMACAERFEYAERSVREIFFTDGFFREARDLLAEYFASRSKNKNRVYVVLPNESVGIETFDLPDFRPHKLRQALEAKLINEYGDEREKKKFNRFLVKNVKQYTVVAAVIYNKETVNAVLKLCGELGLQPQAVTYSANALMNSAYHAEPDLRKKSFLFADIRFDHTEISVSSEGGTVGFVTVPYGTDICIGHPAGERVLRAASESARKREFEENLVFSDAHRGNTDSIKRNQPVTEEDILYENFKTIVKWIFLYARSAQMSDVVVPPEFVLINISDERRFLLDRMRGEQDGGLPFRLFQAERMPFTVKAHMNLEGCLYAKTFNKRHNY